MTKKRIAVLCDAILSKFKVNEGIPWNDIHGNKKAFNDLILDSDCDKERPDAEEKYQVIEPLLDTLIADGMLQRNDVGLTSAFLSFTDKGYSTYRYIDHLGYVTKHIKERNENWKKNSLAIISIATFFILCFKTCNGSFDNPKIQIIDSTKTQINKSIITAPLLPDSETNLNQTSKDSIPKQ